MSKIYNTYKASEEGFEEKYVKRLRNGYTELCGIESDFDAVMHIKSFNRASALALLESVREMIKEKIKMVENKSFYNLTIDDIMPSIEQAEQLITHKCCDGECNRDDCCGKVEANCPLKL
jgi:hypothetical protein